MTVPRCAENKGKCIIYIVYWFIFHLKFEEILICHALKWNKSSFIDQIKLKVVSQRRSFVKYRILPVLLKNTLNHLLHYKRVTWNEILLIITFECLYSAVWHIHHNNLIFRVLHHNNVSFSCPPLMFWLHKKKQLLIAIIF